MYIDVLGGFEEGWIEYDTAAKKVMIVFCYYWVLRDCGIASGVGEKG